MIWRILRTLFSMLLNWHRAPGRSWQMEFTTRMVRSLFETSRDKPAGWLTAELEKIPVSKNLLARGGHRIRTDWRGQLPDSYGERQR